MSEYPKKESSASPSPRDVSSQCRKHLRSSSVSPQQSPDPEGTSHKRSCTASTRDQARTDSEFLFIHRVNCQHKTTGHEYHSLHAFYQDQPRLFAGDSGASALRGEEVIQDLQQYLEDHQKRRLVIMRSYDCEAYHHLHEDQFSLVKLPTLNPRVPSNLSPYLHMILQDCEPAVPIDEEINAGRSLSRAFGRLTEIIPNILPNLADALKPPFLQLYHGNTVVRRAAEANLVGDDLNLVLSVLGYIEHRFGAEYREAEDLFSRGFVTPDHLFRLFRQNDLLVKVEDEEPVCYVIQQGPVVPSKLFALDCYKWSFDGAFRRQHVKISVQWPSRKSDAIPITDLSSLPLRYEPTGRLEEALRERGKMFWSCRKRRFLSYQAPSAAFEIQVSKPRYMVDIMTYRELHPENSDRQSMTGVDDLGKEAMEKDEPPPEPFVLLLPPRIMGFGLHDKKWRTLLVRCLRPVSWNKRAFEQLVLDPQKKELVEAMVRMHMLSSISTDVIEDKGKGLIILLHGGPGTGKTLTAESIAELVERPLYRVTCGDIGTDPESVERYLGSVLYIGRIWQAVVLLDESDVFLEEREKTDLQRNALVSVFLRVLEYYEGILILTSNRVGHFDEAFKSRVQLALHYPPLDTKGRMQIWHNFINMLERQQASPSKEGILDGERVEVDQIRDNIGVLANEKLNGRQIRNCITTARQLARFRNHALGFGHLQQTIKIANEFEEYVENAHGHSASEYAKASGLRLE